MNFFKKKPKQPVASLAKKDPAMVERGLEAIYLDAKGRVPDLGRFERSARLDWKGWIGV